MKNNTAPLFEPDIRNIEQHLDFLFGTTDADYKDGYIEISYLKGSEFFPLSNINEAAQKALEWNKAGKNVYTTAAILKPDIIERVKQRGGRSKTEDFYGCNSVWADLDDIESRELLRERYEGAPPNYYVVTGREPNLRAHLWWNLEKTITDKDYLEAINKGIIQKLGGDKGTHNCTRLMRLAGSIAWPVKDGRITEKVYGKETDFFPPHDPDFLKSFYDFAVTPTAIQENQPLVKPDYLRNTSLNLQQSNEWSLDDIMDMLQYVQPDSEYYDWLSIGMALKDYGVPFEIWDAWSAKGTKYSGRQDMQKKWESFKGSGTTIGTLYYHAHSAGYRAQKSQSNTYSSNFAVTPTAITEDNETVNPETGEIIDPVTFPLLYASDIKPVTETNDFVEDLLRRNEFSVIYGESNCGKTFFMMDVALKVATGQKWHDRNVEQGGVIYAALEGGHGVQNRIAAYKEYYGITDKIPLAVIPSSVNFLDREGDIVTLINSIKKAQDIIGKPQLIVIDTLARAISGGDENSSTDMGQIVINADLVRQHTGAHISFVHHSGKDAVKGARGHSSLRAAVDTEIEIGRDDEHSPSRIKIVKQREMEMLPEHYFKLERVILGKNQRGKEVTSCVPLPTDGIEKVQIVRLNPIQQFIYDCLVDAIIMNGAERRIYKDQDPIKCVDYDELREVMEDRGFKEIMETEKKTTAQQIKSATQNARMALRKHGKVNFDGKYIWPQENIE